MQAGRAVSAVLIAVAFGTGVALGMSRQEPEAQQTTRVFSAGIGVLLDYVKSGQTAAFEATMKRVGEALSTSESLDRRRQAAQWKIYRATEPLEGGVVLYISVLDPVVSGADYWVPQILNEAFPTEVQALYETYAGTFADGQILLNLSPVVGS
jgi:hypothetical protein